MRGDEGMGKGKVRNEEGDRLYAFHVIDCFAVADEEEFHGCLGVCAGLGICLPPSPLPIPHLSILRT